MGRCAECGGEGPEISQALGACRSCILGGRLDLWERLEAVHVQARKQFGLPAQAPRVSGAESCPLCIHSCRIGMGMTSYCGLRSAHGGRIVGGEVTRARVDWYFDPLPTNCVADWVCPGGSGAGYPRFASVPGPEIGSTNLAVFYRACTFNCLFCQNWQHRMDTGRTHSARELAEAVDAQTACICFFGGDPTPQLPHALKAARLARQDHPGKILRICWETNGSMASRLLEEMLEVSLESGGCVKFDLKAFDDRLHSALCGVSNTRTLENFRRAGRHIGDRPDPPVLVASTLLVPGYVTAAEVRRIAEFIFDLDSSIPYALLAFSPQFLMSDLPPTSRRQATECLEAALGAGLKRVRLGNTGLLASSDVAG